MSMAAARDAETRIDKDDFFVPCEVAISEDGFVAFTVPIINNRIPLRLAVEKINKYIDEAIIEDDIPF